MRARIAASVLLAIVALAARAAEAGHCSLVLFPDIPVTMEGLKPMVHVQINGREALLIADSGAFFSMVAPQAVKEYGLTVDPSIQGLSVRGIGGAERAEVARAKTFSIVGKQFANVDFIAAGSVFGGAVGVLGQNFFRIADVEYDLANGVIRLVRPKDCGRDAPLAYWAAAARKPYSVIDIEFATPAEPHTESSAYLNGKRIKVMFDTGSAATMLTVGAARRAGITPESEGVTPGGSWWGIGRGVAKTWIGRFKSFKIGDEEIENARLRFGDIELYGVDMVIGADFFLSHRVYVASSQSKLYFTYNGGPVFDLTQRTPVEPGTADAGDHGGTSAPAPPAAVDENGRLDQPSDAAGYARRGAAFDARHEYQDAIADLTRACELAPTAADYFYERGVVYWHNKQIDLAAADFDQAIKLRPDDVDALIARASLRASRHATTALIAADLETADRALPNEAAEHMSIGALYTEIGQPAAAVVQFSKWIDAHRPDELGMAGALNARCWARALTGDALSVALADCNAALNTRPHTPEFLDSRGLVYLRQGNYDKAIADYDAALRQQPKLAWSLYGRGLARLRKGLTDAGQADIAAATVLVPDIAARARLYGIGP